MDNGADVTNISMAAYTETSVVDEAIGRTVRHDAIVIAAADDLGSIGLRQLAALPGVVGVAAVARLAACWRR